MTREEVKKLMPEATDEQISAFLTAHHSEIDKKTKGLNESLSALKEKAELYDKEQAAKLSEQEKYQKLISEAEAAKAESMRLLSRTKAEAKLLESGLSKEIYGGLLDIIVSDDEAKTLAATEALIKSFSANAATAAAAAKQEAMQTPPPVGGQAPNALQAAQEQLKNAANGSILDIIKAADNVVSVDGKN